MVILAFDLRFADPPAGHSAETPPEVRKILEVSDTVICFVFIADFFIQLVRAERKWQYLKWGWIDLISSIPTLAWFRVGRTVRIIRILRILRAFRSTRVLLNYLLANRAKSVLACAACISLTLVVFSSVAILNVEDSKDANIKNAEDALWWSVVTITTVDTVTDTQSRWRGGSSVRS